MTQIIDKTELKEKIVNFKVSQTMYKALIKEMKEDGYNKLSPYMRKIVEKVIGWD